MSVSGQFHSVIDHPCLFLVSFTQSKYRTGEWIITALPVICIVPKALSERWPIKCYQKPSVRPYQCHCPACVLYKSSLQCSHNYLKFTLQPSCQGHLCQVLILGSTNCVPVLRPISLSSPFLWPKFELENFIYQYCSLGSVKILLVFAMLL